MKLVDILARELKVWPEMQEGGNSLEQDLDNAVIEGSGCGTVDIFMLSERADDWEHANITRAEWQAAVDALKVAEGIADAEAGNLIPLDDVKAKYVEYSPAMHAQRVGRVTRGASQPALGDSREQFEQAYSEDNGVVPVAFLMTCRQGDSYSVPKVARAWYWWKLARAGVVVDMTGVDFNNPGDILLALEKASVKVAV